MVHQCNTCKKVFLGGFKFNKHTDNIFNCSAFYKMMNGNDIEYEISKLFYKMNDNKFACVKGDRCPIWYVYNEGLWEKHRGVVFINSEVRKQIKFICNLYIELLADNEYIEKLKHIKMEFKMNKFNDKLIDNLEVLFKDESFIDKLDVNPDLLCFDDMVFVLSICKWRRTMPEDYCALKCGVTYDKLNDSYEEIINKILLDIFTTEERKQYMLNIFSMFLSGRNIGQSFCVWLGNGPAGKTLIHHYLRAVFGDYCCSLSDYCITKVMTKVAKINYNLCMGRGTRIAFFSDLNGGTKLNNDSLHKWANGQQITCRSLWEKPICYDSLCKIIITCTTPFQLKNKKDVELIDKMGYVNFKSAFVEHPQLEYQKLRNFEYLSNEFIDMIKGSFMNMLIKNYERLKDNDFKFDIPNDIIDDKNKFVKVVWGR